MEDPVRFWRRVSKVLFWIDTILWWSILAYWTIWAMRHLLEPEFTAPCETRVCDEIQAY